MKKIILHLGVHKTATTYFQTRLLITQKLLEDHGVLYLPLFEVRNLITRAINKNSPLSPDVMALMSSGKTLLISDENILGGLTKPMGRGGYPNARKRLLTFMDLVGDCDIQVHLTIRNPEDYLVSRYCERLRHASFISIYEYLEGLNTREFSWLFLINTIRSVLKVEPVVSTYESIFSDERAYLKKLTGVDINFYPATASHSIRRSKISQEAYEILGKISQYYPDHVVKQCLNTLERAEPLVPHTPLRPFSKSLSQRLQDNYLKDKQALGID